MLIYFSEVARSDTSSNDPFNALQIWSCHQGSFDNRWGLHTCTRSFMCLILFSFVPNRNVKIIQIHWYQLSLRHALDTYFCWFGFWQLTFFIKVSMRSFNSWNSTNSFTLKFCKITTLISLLRENTMFNLLTYCIQLLLFKRITFSCCNLISSRNHWKWTGKVSRILFTPNIFQARSRIFKCDFSSRSWFLIIMSIILITFFNFSFLYLSLLCLFFSSINRLISLMFLSCSFSAFLGYVHNLFVL